MRIHLKSGITILTSEHNVTFYLNDISITMQKSVILSATKIHRTLVFLCDMNDTVPHYDQMDDVFAIQIQLTKYS
jgi:hypothetical protein